MEAITAVPAPVTSPETTREAWPHFDHDIGMTEARELIQRFRRSNPGRTTAGLFTRVAFDRILSQQGVAGIRVYFGQNPDGTTALIMVGADEFGNDMDEGELAEKSFPCPPWCPMDSALDS